MTGGASSLLLGFYHKNFTKFVALLIINLGEAKGEVAAALPTHFHYAALGLQLLIIRSHTIIQIFQMEKASHILVKTLSKFIWQKWK